MDHHATTPVDPRVLEAMEPYFTRIFGNAASRNHVFGWEAEAAVDEARAQIADAIGAQPKEIVFTSGATESDNLALTGVARAHRSKGDHLVTAKTEHSAVLDTCRALEREGFSVTYLDPDPDGTIPPARVAEALTDRTVLVSLLFANNEIGVLQDVAAIGALCRDRSVLFHTDAVQAFGKVPFDVETMRIDLASLTAHKLYGPKGIGALYVRSRSPRVRLEPILHGGGHERGMRSGTLNVPGVVGFGKAATLAAAEREDEARRLRALRERLYRGITAGVEGVTLNGPALPAFRGDGSLSPGAAESRLPGNLNLSFAHVEGEALLLGMKDVAVSSGSACTSATLKPSHVLKAIGVPDELAHASIRFGLGRWNTAEEVDFTVEAASRTVRRAQGNGALSRLGSDLTLLADLARGLPAYADLLSRVREGKDRPIVSGGAGALPGLLLAALARDLVRPLLLVVADEKEAERLLGDLAAGGLTRLFHAPAPTLTPFQRIPPSLKSRRDEFALLAGLAIPGTVEAAVLPARALFTRLPAPDVLAKLLVTLETGADVSLPRLVARLTEVGYRRGDLVIETGDLAVRGGLFDVFPPDRELPVRVELDGDRIASLRVFDPDTQRSTEKLSRVVVPPFSVAPESDEARRLLGDRLGRPPSEAERIVFAPAATPMPASWLDHAAGAVLAVLEPAAVEEELSRWEERAAADRDPDRDPFLPEELLHEADAIRRRLAGAALALDRVGLETGGPRVRLPAEAVAGHGGRTAEAAAELGRALADGEEIFIAARPTGGAEKLKRFALEYGLHVSSERREGALVLVAAEISAGFRLRAPRLALYAENEIFGEEKRSPAARARLSEAFLSDLRDLKLGDAVVHRDYGIGLFKGLKRVPVEGQEREFMEIGYAEEKVLLLPVERFDLVQKYSGVEGVQPVLDRLGGAGWARRTASVRKAMRDMTDQLLKLYARRSLAQGFAFSKDSPWQKEFEDAFEFVETPDQAQAIADVKRDMQSEKPMDRLLCGDVGYGKTEVAMRAAFKAVLDGKQVALLAPTTILADQHFRTFQRRFAAFPVTIELLSRFRSRMEQKEIVSKVADGSVDILIATHRMLGKDLAFRDLGLLIVDEEQRFGVAQKEKLKEWKASIDVLSMSATPIPRSLHLSLSGLRDLSIIETPPRDRLAIETQVVPRKAEVVREAIEAEIARGGQVFFVHNRVESIGGVKTELEELVPSVKIAVAHGAMREVELEKAMRRFTSREADLLLATTIIENGLDIPSANTILIDRAENYGLAQLYQLRGRVGRSDKPAYAYLLVKEATPLSDVARRRLASIQEFCDLGAGFRIAAKDLEIRGSGNMLGGEQSGHIAAVGFEMYLQLLEEAIGEMRGLEPKVERAVTFALGLDLAIPPSYVADENWRMMIYKKVARASDEATLEETAREIADRFGEPPPPLSRLYAYARLRMLAERLGVTAITRQAGRVHVRVGPRSAVDPERALEIVRATPGASLSPAGVLTLPAPQSDVLLEALQGLLERIEVRAA